MTTATSTRRSAAEVPPKAAKPTSPTKAAANRRNSRRSTGPRTAAGKRRSSRNALKHGILSTQLIPDDRLEERALFDAMHQALIDEYAPTTMMETFLVERIAICYWRMRRLVIAENQAIHRATRSARNIAAMPPADPIPDPCALPTQSTLALYSRYDVTLERQIYRAMEQLARLRRDRFGVRRLDAAFTSPADPSRRGDACVAHSPADPAGMDDTCVAHLSPDKPFLRNELIGDVLPADDPPQPLQPLEYRTRADHSALSTLPSLLVGTTGDYHAGKEPCFGPDEGILPNEAGGGVLLNSPGVQHPGGAAAVDQPEAAPKVRILPNEPKGVLYSTPRSAASGGRDQSARFTKRSQTPVPRTPGTQ